MQYSSGSGYWCAGISFYGSGTPNERTWLYEDDNQIKHNAPSADNPTSRVIGVQFCLDPSKNWMRESSTVRPGQMVKMPDVAVQPPAHAPKSKDAMLTAYRKQVDDECDAVLAKLTRAHMMRIYFKINALGITLNGPAGSLMTEYRLELERQLAKLKHP